VRLHGESRSNKKSVVHYRDFDHDLFFRLPSAANVLREMTEVDCVITC